MPCPESRSGIRYVKGTATMSAALHRRRVAAAALALVLASACGGERRADTGAADTAGPGVGPVSPTDTVTAVTPDTSTRTAAVTDTSSAVPTPGSSVARRSTVDTAAARAGRAERDQTAAGEAAQQPPAAKPAPAPKPAQRQPRDTQTETGAAARTQDTASAQSATGGQAATPAEQQAAAPAEQPAANAPLRDQFHQAPRDTVTQVVYDGWKQYNLNCARCHGEDVLGSTIAPHLVLSLKPDGPINTKEAFIQVVCAGRPEKGMPAWCPLGMEMEKIEQIFAYVKGRSEGEIGPGRPALREGG